LWCVVGVVIDPGLVAFLFLMLAMCTKKHSLLTCLALYV